MLTGMRGKTYEFSNEQNARNWLSTNLERWKNKTEPTSIEHQLMLGRVYLDAGYEPVQIEIKAINEYERGLWSIDDDDILTAGGFTGGGGNNDGIYDGGDAFTVYEVNP